MFKLCGFLMSDRVGVGPAYTNASYTVKICGFFYRMIAVPVVQQTVSVHCSALCFVMCHTVTNIRI